MNPEGVNQLGNSHVPYGQAKKMKQLAGEAPMSGAPLAQTALNAPRRARRNPQPKQAQPVSPPPALVPEYQTLPQVPPDEHYANIAAIPGASPLVQQIFGIRPSSPGPSQTA